MKQNMKIFEKFFELSSYFMKLLRNFLFEMLLFFFSTNKNFLQQNGDSINSFLEPNRLFLPAYTDHVERNST